MAKKKISSLRQQYIKEINRLKRAKSRGEKLGYIFEEDTIPALPERVTKKRLQQIKETKPSHLYEKAIYVDRGTGEIIPAKVQRKNVRKMGVEKAKKTRQRKKQERTSKDVVVGKASITTTIRQAIQSIPDTKGTWNRKLKMYKFNDFTWIKQMYLGMLDELSSEMSDTELEQYLLNNQDEIMSIITNINYYDSESEEIYNNIWKLGEYLKGSSLTHEEMERLSPDY